ncbi:hypothetical protein Cabys_3303 [Caldithrix abyssi DSM 13497]|uniref:Uncharacterized protein n=1 Tax=Caldithrix abyssi DSM 13497 TaxID=880073 RepID=A0A1J1CBG3_CALAY|nr:hypothetical protein Cabys_3303 [Caldithrix abyssi DSM 13497]
MEIGREQLQKETFDLVNRKGRPSAPLRAHFGYAQSSLGTKERPSGHRAGKGKLNKFFFIKILIICFISIE